MKNLILLVSMAIIIITVLSCTTSKKIERQNNTDINHNKKEYDGSDIKSPYIILSCDGRTGNYSKKLGRMEKGELDLLICVSNKAYEGDSASINKIASILPYDKAPFRGNLMPYRGKKLFPIVLNMLNDYTITPDETAMSDQPYAMKKMIYLFDMIDKINDLNPYDYMRKNTTYPSIDEYDLASEAYNIALAKSYWFTINEAYTKGLIKYKSYGQK